MLHNVRNNNGVDKGLIDLVFNGDNSGFVTTKIWKRMYKKGSNAFLGFQHQLHDRDVVRVGNLGLRYRIIGGIRDITNEGAYVYKVKRVDNANITQLDIDNILLKQQVLVVSKKSVKQKIQDLHDMLNRPRQQGENH